MRHLKTFEQVQDFYGGEKRYAIVTTDEKYVVNSYGSRRGTKIPLLHPIENLEKSMDKFLYTHNPIDKLKDYNDSMFNYKSELDGYELEESEYYQRLKDEGIKSLNDEEYSEKNSFKIVEFQVGIQLNKPLNI